MSRKIGSVKKKTNIYSWNADKTRFSFVAFQTLRGKLKQDLNFSPKHKFTKYVTIKDIEKW